MQVVLTFGIVAVLLFVGSFFAKRRFGLLALALAAGWVLSGIWQYEAEFLVGALGAPSSPITSAIVLSAITLLPAVLLLFHGYAYKGKLGRIIGSVLFAVLGLTFLVEPIGHVLAVEGVGADIYRWFADNRLGIIGAGLVAAIVDLFLTKPVSSSTKKK